MPYERLNIQLAVKLGAGDSIPPALLAKPTTAQLNAMANMTWLAIIREMIKRFKIYSENINAGTEHEEETRIAKRHTCDHDLYPDHKNCIEEDI